MAKTNWHIVPCTFSYAKVFESNRDMGNEHVDFSATDGQYQVVAIIDEETKNKMLKYKVPEVVLGHKMFKEVEDGMFSYRFKRPHISKYLKDKEGDPVVVGPPNLYDYKASVKKQQDEGGNKPWEQVVDWEENKFIGDGSTGYVKFSVYEGKNIIVQLEAVSIDEHIPFETDDDTPMF